MPYSHQTDTDSGATLLELPSSQPHNSMASHDVYPQSQLRRQSYGGAMEQDVGLLAPGPAGYHYDTPYEDDDGPGRDRIMTASPSIGPWDSASQRSLPYHSQQSFPLPQPSHMPLAGNDTLSSREKHFTDSYNGYEDGEYYHTDKPNTPRTMTIHRIPTLRCTKVKVNVNVKVKKPGLDRLLSLFNIKAGAYPVEQAIERKKRGLGGQKYPVAAWNLTAAMTAIMVYEMVRNYQAMGTPIAIKPVFNYMIGPSSEVLINIGARFPPCMKNVSALPATFELACLNDTSSSPTTGCTIEQICGHGGFHGETPDQWWRFILPIFLHVGIIHLIINMLVQITASAQVEREMGTIPFLIVYMLGGIYGFVLGGNFTRTGIPSVGASGALFATNACVLVDLVLHWKYEERPKMKACLLVLELGIGFAMGYIPNAVDGLAHLGGWAMGILCGIILYPAITETKRRKYVVWGCRVVAVALIIMAMVMTIKNFCTGITTTGTSTTKRSWDLL
ncbi:rhomboid family membrane protein [Cryptococcus deuterogattii 99/473]|uniref:Rhomboid-type serine protease n=1 Tax=Cryptococcus deuterogattii Ram5 TaxID=1296110 RepID=A0A0D0UYP5_9TREE|nr:rhomboid family membrane protein [Cryptococcus deuterogattii Ram5]KIY56710.1 rhomboid family membrane protein [Cryptococcus deuterogattii 99/473]